jgi:hypothetical protein
MDDIRKSIDFLESIDLQILWGLHKMENVNKLEGQHDIERVAKKCKAAFKPIDFKLGIIQKEMKALTDENKKLKHGIQNKTKLEAEVKNLNTENKKKKIEKEYLALKMKMQKWENNFIIPKMSLALYFQTV